MLRCTIVSQGAMFGEVDAIFERPYTMSVRCVSLTGELYAFPAEEFVRRLKSNPASWEMANRAVLKKEFTITKRLQQKDKDEQFILRQGESTRPLKERYFKMHQKHFSGQGSPQ